MVHGEEREIFRQERRVDCSTSLDWSAWTLQRCKRRADEVRHPLRSGPAGFLWHPRDMMPDFTSRLELAKEPPPAYQEFAGAADLDTPWLAGKNGDICGMED